MENLLEVARRVMPGGTFGSFALDHEVDCVIKRGIGSKVYDVAGREYIDCVNGSGPMLIGHAHPDVVTALHKAVEWPSNSYLLNETGIELAAYLVDAIPCAEQIKYGVTGSDSTLNAMRLARAFTGRDKILKFEGGYLGGNEYALMSTRPSEPLTAFPRSKPDSAGIPKVLEEEVLVAPFNDLSSVENILNAHGPDIAAVILEAQQRSIEPRPGFLEGLRTLCNANRSLLIFDEIVTGFRLAWGGAQERYKVLPDLAAYGKVIGGGMPLSAVAGRREILQLADPRRASDPRYCFIGGTSCGNGVAAAAGLATLAVLRQPGTYARLDQIGDRFRSGTAEILSRRGVSGQVIGSGPIAQIVLTDKPVVDYRTSISGDLLLQRRLTTEIVRRGVLTQGKFYFSLAITDDDLDRILAVLDDSFQALLR